MEKLLNFEEGEMVCNKCEGSGKSWIYTTLCSKCQGKGKVDWIENIVGKKPPTIFTDSSASINFSVIAQQLANQIDQEIMESLVAQSEQNNKMKAAAVLSEIGRINF